MVQSRTVHRFLGRTGRLFIVATLTLLANGAVSPPAVHALAFEVDTSVDNAALTDCTAAANDCSLRGAISRARGEESHD